MFLSSGLRISGRTGHRKNTSFGG
jgi:hypothetical protein